MSKYEPWVEKYRPRLLDDVVGNGDIVDRLKVIAEDGDMPHLLLCGPPGIGKTTSIHCLARQLLGDAYDRAVLEMNASDARGIDVVRTRIKNHAQTQVTLPEGRKKILILDECDSMTPAAQQALRRIMELYASSTRFCLACNTSSKVIEPIQSRCAILRFTRLSPSELNQRLVEVLDAEGATYDEEGLQMLLFIAEGDMRKALNTAEACATGFGVLNKENILRVADVPSPEALKGALLSVLEGKLRPALAVVQSILEDGYAVDDLLRTFFSIVKYMDGTECDERTKLVILKIIGFAQRRSARGCSGELQMTALLSDIFLQIHPE